jgi:hypothetical protein
LEWNAIFLSISAMRSSSLLKLRFALVSTFGSGAFLRAGMANTSFLIHSITSLMEIQTPEMDSRMNFFESKGRHAFSRQQTIAQFDEVRRDTNAL